MVARPRPPYNFARLSQAYDVFDSFRDDIAVAQLQGAITTRCGPGALTIGRSVERLLSQGRLGTALNAIARITLSALASPAS